MRSGEGCLASSVLISVLLRCRRHLKGINEFSLELSLGFLAICNILPEPATTRFVVRALSFQAMTYRCEGRHDVPAH